MIASQPVHVGCEPRHRLATAGGADRYDEAFQSHDEARFGQLRLLRRGTSSDGCRAELEGPSFPSGSHGRTRGAVAECDHHIVQSRDAAHFVKLRLLRRINSGGCRVELEEPAPAGCGHQGLRFCGPRLQRQTRP
jgi:hypothetical protein